jgi:hypothetical protein
MEENPYCIKRCFVSVPNCIDIQRVGKNSITIRENPCQVRDKPLQRDISHYKFAADKKRKTSIK